jgi:hypothetical protein
LDNGALDSLLRHAVEPSNSTQSGIIAANRIPTPLRQCVIGEGFGLG